MPEPESVLHPEFLPYRADELLEHFVEVDESTDDDARRHLRGWQKRIADAPEKDPAYLDRDETL